MVARPWTRPWQRGATPETPEGTGTFGLVLFFISLSVLFLASAVGIIVVRHQSPDLGIRVAFPVVGWVSTGALGAVSLSMHLGMRALREDRMVPFQVAMITTLVAALVFLGLQAHFWSELLLQEVAYANTVASGLYAFFVMTGLHAAHVLGGVLMQSLVTVRALRRDYWSLHCGQVRGTALYWHFIDAVWVLLVLFLLWVR